MGTNGSDPFPQSAIPGQGPVRSEAARLTVVFGVVAFVQGLAEPTDGLLAQPVRSLLRARGLSVSEITSFAAVVALPWLLKPLFGVLSDFCPLAGSRRKSYLVISGGATSIALLAPLALRSGGVSNAQLLFWLTMTTATVAVADVVTDALMVETGRPTGLTGRLQAVQWACANAAGLAAGLVGGELAERHAEWTAFLICGLAPLVSLAVVVPGIQERGGPASGTARRATLRVLRSAAGTRTVAAVAAFLFLWSFNPFTNAVLHLHMTTGLGLGERFYGRTVSLTALASIAACVAYGFYCRRVSIVALAHASIALGLASTLGYLFVRDESSAVVVTLLAGFLYMTATLIQLDIAARHCPPSAAGTVFASLMALCNLAAVLGVWAGGQIYERGTRLWGTHAAFNVLIVVSAATTACCWLLTPVLPRGILRRP